MICPNCGAEMKENEYCGITLDYCEKCDGFWLDADEWVELQKLLNMTSEVENPLFQQSITSYEKVRKCPICNRGMDKIKIKYILIDKCPAYHGVWFDGNELKDFFNSQKDATITSNSIENLIESFKGKNDI